MKTLLYTVALFLLPACGLATNSSPSVAMTESAKVQATEMEIVDEDDSIEPLFLGTNEQDRNVFMVEGAIPSSVSSNVCYAVIGEQLLGVKCEGVSRKDDTSTVTRFIVNDSSIIKGKADVALLVDSVYASELQFMKFDVMNTPAEESVKLSVTKEFEGKIEKSNTLISFDDNGKNSVSAVLLRLSPNVRELLLVYSKSGKPTAFAEYPIDSEDGIDVASVCFSSVMKVGKDYSFIISDGKARYLLSTNGDSIEEKLVCAVGKK